MSNNNLINAIDCIQMKHLIGFKIESVIDTNENILIELVNDRNKKKYIQFNNDEGLLYCSCPEVDYNESFMDPVECVISQMMKRTDISEEEKNEVAFYLRSSK